MMVFKYLASIYLFFNNISPFFKYLFNYWRGILNPIDLKNYGEWAVITGGSDGIGKGYAFELAKRGLNICIISRTESKLKSVCDKMTKEYGVKAEYITFDFNEGDYQELYKKLKSFSWFEQIGVLVNNVGFLAYGYDSYAKFGVTVGDKSEDQILKLRCVRTCLCPAPKFSRKKSCAYD